MTGEHTRRAPEAWHNRQNFPFPRLKTCLDVPLLLLDEDLLKGFRDELNALSSKSLVSSLSIMSGTAFRIMSLRS